MIKRGELYYADLSPVVGSEQGGVRPILIVQNDIGNKYSPTVIAAAVTSKINKAKLPTHIELSAADFGLVKDSVVLLEQIRTLDKRRLKERIGELSPLCMRKVDNALLISLGFGKSEITTTRKSRSKSGFFICKNTAAATKPQFYARKAADSARRYTPAPIPFPQAYIIRTFY